MTTEIANTVHIAQVLETDLKELAKVSPENVALELKDKYMKLVIIDINDKSGAKVVEEARKHVKKLRTGLEAKRKELNADALSYTKTVNAEAKRLTELISPIEEYLEKEENRYKDGLEREKNLAIAKAQQEEAERLEKIAQEAKAKAERSMARQKQLVNLGSRYQEINGTEHLTLGALSFDLSSIADASDEVFGKLLEHFQTEHDKIEKDKLVKERTARRINILEKLGAEWKPWKQHQAMILSFDEESTCILTQHQLETCSDEDFEKKYLPEYKSTKGLIDAKIKADKDMVEQQKLANEAKENELAEKEAKMKAEKFKNRLQSLDRVELNGREVTFESEEVILTVEEMENMSDADFAEFVVKHNKRMSTIDNDRILMARAKQVSQWNDSLITLGAVIKEVDGNPCYVIGNKAIQVKFVNEAKEDFFENVLKELSEEADRLDTLETEKRRLELLPDKEKMTNFYNQVKDLLTTKIELDTKKANAVMKQFNINAGGLLHTLATGINNLK